MNVKHIPESDAAFASPQPGCLRLPPNRKIYLHLEYSQALKFSY